LKQSIFLDKLRPVIHYYIILFSVIYAGEREVIYMAAKAKKTAKKTAKKGKK
jgi:hypothetical protein